MKAALTASRHARRLGVPSLPAAFYLILRFLPTLSHLFCAAPMVGKLECMAEQHGKLACRSRTG